MYIFKVKRQINPSVEFVKLETGNINLNSGISMVIYFLDKNQNTVEKIVRTSNVTKDSHVLEVGPGLGSLTLALLAKGAKVTAVEIDSRLAELLPITAKSKGKKL